MVALAKHSLINKPVCMHRLAWVSDPVYKKHGDNKRVKLEGEKCYVLPATIESGYCIECPKANHTQITRS